MASEEDDLYTIDPQTAWLETVTIGGFRIWHIIAFCIGILMSIIIIVCCCFRFRIPRTKQEIEADFQRKQITKKFREKLQHIKNSEMDDMDLQRVLPSNISDLAIEHIRADLLAAAQNNVVEQSSKEQLIAATNVKFKF